MTATGKRFHQVVYAVRCGQYMKVGYSSDLQTRMRSLNYASRGCQHPDDLPAGEPAVLVGWLNGDLRVEMAIHRALSERRAHGDWYHLDDFMERWARSLPFHELLI